MIPKVVYRRERGTKTVEADWEGLDLLDPERWSFRGRGRVPAALDPVQGSGQRAHPVHVPKKKAQRCRTVTSSWGEGRGREEIPRMDGHQRGEAAHTVPDITCLQVAWEKIGLQNNFFGIFLGEEPVKRMRLLQ